MAHILYPGTRWRMTERLSRCRPQLLKQTLVFNQLSLIFANLFQIGWMLLTDFEGGCKRLVQNNSNILQLMMSENRFRVFRNVIHY